MFAIRIALIFSIAWIFMIKADDNLPNNNSNNSNDVDVDYDYNEATPTAPTYGYLTRWVNNFPKRDWDSELIDMGKTLEEEKRSSSPFFVFRRAPSCVRRGGICDHRPNDCCFSSSCRCNLWGSNCRCQRMGLFQKWG